MGASASLLLDDLISRLQAMPDDAREEVERAAAESTRDLLWVPNPGPQTAALESEADELFYGGEAGGGKSDLVLGAALTKHRRSLVLRRIGDDARALAERMLEMVPNRNGYNAQLLRYVTDQRVVDFGGCREESDKQRYKGRPHDLIAFDEIGDFVESQYRFIIGWNRSTTPGQRVRVIATGNPPTTAEGLWVIAYWAAWLDPKHPNPAAPGELRWYTTGADGGDIEVDGPGPHVINGEMVVARSRTFIRASLDDNPDLVQTDDYKATLAALPSELRAAYRDGNFSAGLRDDPWQLLPTEWVRAAQERWTQRPAAGVPQCALGVDVAQGGVDDNVIAPRYDGWYDQLVVVPGSELPLGSDVGPHVLMARKAGAVVVLDCGGGYGGSTYKTLKENGLEVIAYKGAEAATGRTEDTSLPFVNLRAQVWWRFREALDPGQPFGSPIALPHDRELLQELTTMTYKVGPRGIQLPDAEQVHKKLGRSPDRATAVVLSWAGGARNITHHYMGLGNVDEQGLRARPQRQTKAITGRRHSNRR